MAALCSDMVGRGALDFIDGIVGTGTVNVAVPVDVVPMHFYHFSAHPSGFRIPADAITDLKRLDHDQYWPRSAAARLTRPASRSSMVMFPRPSVDADVGAAVSR
jgi:hypothetical protein